MVCVVCSYMRFDLFIFCFFNDTETTEIDTYVHTVSLHDAVPIWVAKRPDGGNLRVETMVIGQIEMKRHRTCRRGSINHVEPNDFAAAVDQEMFGVRPPPDPRIS